MTESALRAIERPFTEAVNDVRHVQGHHHQVAKGNEDMGEGRGIANNADLLRAMREDRAAEKRALDRAYPLAKQLAEILELEAVPQAKVAKKLRQDIGARLAALGQ